MRYTYTDPTDGRTRACTLLCFVYGLPYIRTTDGTTHLIPRNCLNRSIS